MTDFLMVECAIRQLHARFLDAVWRKDADAFAACFAQDGEWKIAGMHMKGRPEIGGTFARLLGTCERVQILLGLPLLQIGKETATGRINVTELAKLADGSAAMTLGIYFDHYVEEAGNWLFRKRHFSLHYRGPTDLSAPIVDSPHYGPFPAMPSPEEPTLTRRNA